MFYLSFNKNLKPLLLFVILITIFIAQYFLLMFRNVQETVENREVAETGEKKKITLTSYTGIMMTMQQQCPFLRGKPVI